MDGVQYLRKTEKVTKTGLIYHIGERVLTGIKTGKLQIHKLVSLLTL